LSPSPLLFSVLDEIPVDVKLSVALDFRADGRETFAFPQIHAVRLRLLPFIVFPCPPVNFCYPFLPYFFVREVLISVEHDSHAAVQCITLASTKIGILFSFGLLFHMTEAPLATPHTV
jgi:hypothetical protein